MAAPATVGIMSTILGGRCKVVMLVITLPLYQDNKSFFITPQRTCLNAVSHMSALLSRKVQKVGYLAETLKFQTKWNALTRNTQGMDNDGAATADHQPNIY